MLFEQFDKKLKDAAENHHPNYDEKAWLKMQKLLEQHLPVDKERRRLLFLILFAFIGLGAAGVLILKPWKDKNGIAIGSKIEESKPILKEAVEESVNEPITDAVDPHPEKSISASFSFQEPAGKKSIVTNSKTARTEKKVSTQMNNTVISTAQSENKKTEPSVERSELKDIFPGTQKKDDVFTSKQEAFAKTDNPVSQALVPVTAKVKNKKKKQHEVFFSLTGGTDWIFIKGNSGSVRPFGGGGIGYIYNKRVSLRTGFYVGRKVYTAEPGAYNPPANFYNYYPYLEKVDANCTIYEIPVSLSYYFGRSGNSDFFASAGVSSFIMKEEAYKYYYKTTPAGPTLNRNYTLKDINRHNFAELTLSGGYTRGLTRHISITAEPYVKLPLKGVGFGKVKLKSAGVALSVIVNPFAKKLK